MPAGTGRAGLVKANNLEISGQLALHGFQRRKLGKGLLKIISFGKLRGSYGTTGSDQIGDYGYLSRWTGGYVSYDGVPPLLASQHVNPDFHWQSVRKTEVALELGFLKDRLRLSTSFYLDRCDDQLLYFPLPSMTGFESVIARFTGTDTNSGLEFLISAKIIDTKTFTVSANFNTSFNKNKLVAYPNFDQSPFYNRYIIGQPLNIEKFVLHYIGVNPQNGEYSFRGPQS